MPSLTDKEATVLGHISKKSSASQRELAKNTGVSLGLINVILQKFAKAGYLKASQLNKRKLQYILTPTGLLETARRSYQFAATTVRNYNQLEGGITRLLRQLHQSGYDYFSIHGDGDLKKMIETTLRSCLEEAPVTLGKEHRVDPRAIVLNISPEPFAEDWKGNCVNVLEKIAAS